MIPTFQSCRSKDPKTLPSNPVPSSSFLQLPHSSSQNHHSHTPPKHHRPSIKRQLSTALSCGLRRSRSSSSPITIGHTLTSHPSSSPATPHFKWEKEDEWNVIAKIHDYNNNDTENSNATPGRRKIYNTSESAPCSSADTEVIIPPPPPLRPRRSKRRGRRNKSTTTVTARRQSLHQLGGIVRLSTSSADSGLFFSEEELEKENELETLVCSSRSFSTTTTDSSTEFSPHLETIREGTTTASRRKKKRSVKKKVLRRTKHSGLMAESKGSITNKRNSTSSEDGTTTASTPPRLSVFKKMMPCGVIEGKVRESFAVVKKTEDPYGEFKRSMMEMVMEKEMFEENELEKLLQCFLSLNSRDHHGAIVQAFAEIWEEMFC